MSGSANTRNVEMGPIWNHADAKTKAEAYIDRRPWLKWTGHWNTAVRNAMSTIKVCNRTSLEGFVRGENRDVDMGPIWNQQDAVRRARAFIEEHPFLEWNGHWNTTEIDGRTTSVIGVRLKERNQDGANTGSPGPSSDASAAPSAAPSAPPAAHSAPPAAPSPPSAAPSPPSAEYVGDKCIVCWQQPINCTLVPCGHLCCCYERCGAIVEKCPICRADIQQRIKTYPYGCS